MEINIAYQWGKLGVDQRFWSSDLKITDSEMKIRYENPALDLSITYPQVDIDYTGTYADMGYKGVVPLEMDNAQAAYRVSMDGVARLAQEGDLLGRIENPVSFASLAESAAFPEKESNVGLMPAVPPDIRFQMGNIRATGLKGSVHVDATFPNLDVIADPGYIKVYLEQQPYVKVTVTGKIFDRII